MIINDIKESFLDAQKVLNEFIADEANFSAIEAAGDAMAKSIKNGGKIISCGNGGSMCDAMHFAEELTGRFRGDRPSMPAVAISDPSHITCVANDYGFDYIFSRYVEGMGQKGDVFLGISTSGNSANIINAVKAAKEKGLVVVGLTGKTGGEMAALCDVEIRVPWEKYSDRVQEIHIKVIHCLIQYIEAKMK
ncbi:D-sedoheptulose 7-phosphate isomerase [Labilibaculum sp. A4]|uniref:D-sedoheptulose 7-phosphate isomerase n=1 Tax=Labilibaculum euxinus TaxID=2686357 RepID=UPI000F624D7F|nr:D-sedoheptulose 7-phosphate isomerase [Labilibaculum euxinus]MDQ1769984.1 D-sedoheptulose 7-phosphate isomerase [Labilibaculum euxinus]MWN77406.1 D-sedoheptulose 7-phosphate isomerase [Labilibaculum euxinus]